MRLSLLDNLPFVTVTLVHDGGRLDIPNVLVDTGSGGTIFAADDVAKIGITPQDEDILRHVHGIGGSEVVFMRKVEQLQVGDYAYRGFEIEVGGMDYGFDIHGILGMDFLLAASARIDLKRLTLEFKA
jgi:predicted aspartyl protease